MKKEYKNLAFIDGQNLHLGTKEAGWQIDLKRFRIYLKENYGVKNAYYFLGFLNDEMQDLYSNLQEAGFIVIFREHNSLMLGKKKGNVDSDIVFEMMKNLIENTDFEKIILVSGDGDYKKVVDFLIKKERFLKVLFPNKKFASSLYKKLGNQYFSHLENIDIKNRIKK